MELAVLVGAVVRPILAKLYSIAFKEIDLASSVQQDLNNLKSNVEFISVCLLNAGNEPVSKDPAVVMWIQNMKSALYDADDLLEEFHYEILSKQRKPVNKLFISNPIKYLISKKAHKIKGINMILDRAVKQGEFLKLTQGLLQRDVGGESSQQQDYGQYGDVSKILGRDGDKSEVIDMLLQSSGDLSVVAIIGLGGLGKTTLAKSIYKDTDQLKFDESIWVCVSTDFNVNSILKEMATDLGIIRGDEKLNTGALIKSLKPKLNTKKYLLVLDDVWNTDSKKWDDLKNCFFEIGADKESKILVTTRNTEVAECMHSHSIFQFQLKGLSAADSWSLFREKAFCGGGAQETGVVTTIGKRMIKRCNGVPLAILTLGALLSTKDENEWSLIEKSDVWDDIMSVLRLSYNHFLPCLKPCFAYCSIFPKDYIFEKDDLIQLWIAQGLIPERKNKLLEDTGNNYFNILVWNSFFQDVKIDYSGNKTCKMHDLVHDLAKSITESEILVLDTNNVNNDNHNVRHLHLLEKGGTIPKIPNGHKLRTLFLACEMRQNDTLKFECLRVLNFAKAYKMKELPQSIGKLKSLRYLNVSNTRIKKIPISIFDLHSLQTIRFMGCKNFEDLPESLGSMINLTHLCFDNYHAKKMPFKLRRLTSLQTLSMFNVGSDKGHMIEELGFLKRLGGKLHIKYVECIKDKNEAESANLMMKTNLFKLNLEWSRQRSDCVNMDEDVLAGLQPPPNLRSLTIENFDGSNFPRWMLKANVYNVIDSNYVQLDCLVQIKLINCKKCERIPTLGELPSLKFLEIRGMASLKIIGREFYNNINNNNKYDNKLVCGGGSSSSCIKIFPLLVTLILEDLNNLVEWSEASTRGAMTMAIEGGILEVFPRLEELSIDHCYELKTAPTHFPFLKRLVYEGVRSGEALSKICHQVTSLTYLEIKRVGELTHMPEGILQNNKNLTSIRIRECEMLECIAREDDTVGLRNLVSLKELEIDWCPKLSHIGSMHGLTSLSTLWIWNCNEIRNVPIGLGSCTSLENLIVKSCGILREEGGLREVESLNCLKYLTMGGFNSELETFPFNCNISLLSNSLKTLELYGWPKLKSLPHQIKHLTALEDLRIYDFDGLKALPDWLENLSSLKYLFIRYCKGLEALPDWLDNLSFLQSLTIWDCENIMRLPSANSLRRLTYLDIRGCTILEERWKKESGPEWSSISHIPYIYLGGETVQDLR